MRQMTTGTINIGESILAYDVAGSGAALVLLHADVTDRRMWDDVGLLLAQDYTVIRYDRPGFGESAPVESLVSHHAMLAGVLDALNIERAHIVGCSGGGEIALNFALAYPERTLSVVAVSTAPGGFEFQGEPPAMLMQMVEALQRGDLPAAAEWTTRIFLAGESRPLEPMDAALRERAYQMALTALNNQAAQTVQREPLEPPVAQRLSDIKPPVLAVAGALDNPELVRAAQFIADGVANGEAWVADGVAHLLPMEIPAAFAARVDQFIARQRVAGPGN